MSAALGFGVGGGRRGLGGRTGEDDWEDGPERRSGRGLAEVRYRAALGTAAKPAGGPGGTPESGESRRKPKKARESGEPESRRKLDKAEESRRKPENAEERRELEAGENLESS